MIESMILFSFLFLLCYIAYKDITKKKIYNNSILILVVIAGICLFNGGYGFSEGLRDSLKAVFIFSGLFILFYLFGFMGAGDVKLGIVLQFFLGFDLFVFVWLFSIVLAVVYGGIFLFLAYSRSFGSTGFGHFGKNIGSGRFVPYGACLAIPVIILIMRV